MNHLNLSIRALPMQRLLPVRSLDEFEHLVKESEVVTGNPGRNEFDETQEIYYPPICKAIADLGYQGYFSHEYSPTKDAPALPTLDKMMKICEV